MRVVETDGIPNHSTGRKQSVKDWVLLGKCIVLCANANIPMSVALLCGLFGVSCVFL